MYRLHHALILTALLSVVSAPAWANLVENGGFEELSGSGFTDWTRNGSAIAPDSVFPNTGSYDAIFTDLNGTVPLSALSQTVPTAAGAQYTLTFSLLDESGLSDDSFHVTFGGFTTIITGDQAAPPGDEPSFYTLFTYNIPGADIGTSLTALTFSATVDPTIGSAWNLDDVSVEQSATVPVPEPTALALLLTGIAGLAYSVRKRLIAREANNSSGLLAPEISEMDRSSDEAL